MRTVKTKLGERSALQAIDRSKARDIDQLLKSHTAILFVARYRNGEIADRSRVAIEILTSYGADVTIFDISDKPVLEEQLRLFSGWQYLPQMFVAGEFIGGAAILDEYFASGEYHRARGLETLAIDQVRSGYQREFNDAIWRIAVGSNTGRLCAGKGDGTVSISNPGDLNKRWEGNIHKGWVNAVCFSSDEMSAYSVGTDRVLNAINVLTNETESLHNAHERWINDVSALPQDGTLVTASADRTVAIWRTNPLSLIVRSQPGNAVYWCASSLGDGELIAVGDAIGHVTFFDRQLAMRNKVQVHRNCITSMVSYESSGVLTGGYDGMVHSVDIAGAFQEYRGHQSRVWSVAVLPDNLIAAAAGDKHILVWRKACPDPIRDIQISEVPLSIAWCSTKRCILVATSGGTVIEVEVG